MVGSHEIAEPGAAQVAAIDLYNQARLDGSIYLAAIR
jgi:hypothetical protein